MKAAVINKLGEPPVYQDFPDPTPGKDEVLLRVTAASLKQIDKVMASGRHYAAPKELPVVSGVDGVGRDDQGKRYYFANLPAPYGAMAEKVAINPAWAFALPDNIDDATAAALPNPAMSSWVPLSLRAKIKAGDRVLVIGATGAAGMLAVQIAKHLGADAVVALGRGQEPAAHLQSIGAEQYIDLLAGDEAVIAALQKQGPFDIVLDYLWGHPAELFFAACTGDSFESTDVITRYVQIGDIAGKEAKLPAESLRSTNLEIMGSGGGGVPHAELFKTVMETMPKLFELAASGTLTLKTETVPLSDVSTVWNAPSKTRILFAP
jgi:NADPH2:quinone reductase